MARIQEMQGYDALREKIEEGYSQMFAFLNEKNQEVPMPKNGAAGTATEYELERDPISETESVFKNGMLMKRGTGMDYTVSGKTITFSDAPELDAVILVNYKYG